MTVQRRRNWFGTGKDDLESDAIIDASRLIGFSDGVFAIAITLLVLSIPVPDLKDPSNAELWTAVQDTIPEFAAYLLSFLVIGKFWLTHHQLLGWVDQPTRGLAVLNLAYLAAIVFMPVPTELVGRYGDDIAAFSIYAATIAVTLSLSFAMSEYINRAGLLRKDAPRYRERDRIVASAVPIVTFVLSIPLSLLFDHPMYYLWLVLIVFNPPVRRVSPKPEAQS